MKRVHLLPEKMNFNQTAVFKIFQRNFRSHYSLFALEKSLKTAKFSWFFTSKKTILVTTLSKTHALIFREYVVEEIKSNPEQFVSDQLFWFHSSVFALEF